MKRRLISKSIPQEIPTKDLVAHYKLWAGFVSTSKVFDYSLNGNTGAVTSAIPAYPGFLFIDGEINCGTDSSIDNIFAGGGTISTWILVSGRGESNAGRVVDKTAWLLQTVLNTTTLRFRQEFDITPGEWEFNITAGTWQHIVLVYDSDLVVNNPTVYLNGVSVFVDEITVPSDTATSDSASDLFIGDAPAGSAAWDGKIGETMLFNTEKTAAESKSIFEIARGRYSV